MTTSCQQTSREWNAADYHRLSTPQFQWGQRVLNDLRLSGDECVLDAGCGTGKLTHLLLQSLPRGRVVGLDLSRNMVQHARRDLQAAFGDRAQFVVADLIALPFRDTFTGFSAPRLFTGFSITMHCSKTFLRSCGPADGCTPNVEEDRTLRNCGSG